jgi:hypothetical protein
MDGTRDPCVSRVALPAISAPTGSGWRTSERAEDVYRDQRTRGVAKGRPAFPGADHLPDLALARSPVVKVQTLDRQVDHASGYWEDHVREEILDRGAVSLACPGST